MKTISRNRKHIISIQILLSILSPILIVLSFFQAYAYADSVFGIDQSNYFSNSQIDTYATEIDCNLTALYKQDNKYMRLISQNDQTIEVALKSNFTPELKSTITESVNYIFSVLKTINPNIDYQITNNDSAEIKLYYMSSADSENMSVAGHTTNNYRFSVCTSSKIYFNQNIVDELSICDKSYTKHIVLHELCHAFGFNDLEINTSVNSIMSKASQEIKLTTLTKNDYACLSLLYSNANTTLAQLKQNCQSYSF